MAEKNIFNKELGKYQTKQEWDDFQTRLNAGHATRADKYNQYGAGDLNWRATGDKLTFGDEGNDIYQQASQIGDDAYSQILNFESGLRGWGYTRFWSTGLVYSARLQC